MTPMHTPKADLLRALETERDWWRAVFDLAAEDVPVTGDEAIDGEWTLKLLVAHIAGWRDWTIARFETAAQGFGKPAAPWPEEMSDSTEAGTDEINAWFAERSISESFEYTAERLFAQLDSLESLVNRMSSDDLLTPGKFGWLDGVFESLPLGPALIGFSITHVHVYHAPAIKAWLTERLGQHAELPPAPSDFGYVD